MRCIPCFLVAASLALALGGCRTAPAKTGATDTGAPVADEGADGAADGTVGEEDGGGSEGADDGGDSTGTDGGAGEDGGDSSGTDGGDGTDGGAGDGTAEDGTGDDGGDGGADGTDDGSGAGDEGGGDEGGESGDEGGTGAETGDDGSSTPVELCNGIDDDGDGEIDEGACPDEVVTDPGTGVAYMAVATHMSWTDAQANCAAYGYTLVTIDDATENDVVWEIIYEGDDGTGLIDAHTWIGYHEPVGDVWQWDGASASYTNFDAEVITDDYGTVLFGQAAAFGDSDDTYWHEAPMTWRYASVCESP